MSDKPVYHWAMAKAMYEFDNQNRSFEDLDSTDPDKLQYLVRGQVAFEAFVDTMNLLATKSLR